MKKKPRRNYNIMKSRQVFEIFKNITLAKDGWISVKELAERSGRERGTISEQIRCLTDHDLIEDRIEGKNKYFKVNFQGAADFFNSFEVIQDKKSFAIFFTYAVWFATNFESFIKMGKKFRWNKSKMPKNPAEIIEKLL